MTEMRAAVLVAPGQFEVQTVPRPEPEVGEVRIRIARTGICGTDLHIFHGAYAADSLPLIPGHELTGHIEALGAGVTGLEEGQAVVVDMNLGCMNCYWCRRNEIMNCAGFRQIGITMNGAFADCLAVPAHRVIPAPSDMPAATLALTEPLACVVRSARKARIPFGASAVVLGAGPIGNLHVQLLRTIGVAPIIASDTSKERRAMARDAGADCVAAPAELHGAVMAATDGRGADFVIESVGNISLYAEARSLLRKGGHLVVFGLTRPDERLELDILRTILEENSLKGSVAGMGEDMHDALTLLRHNRIDTAPFSGAAYDLEDIQVAFDTHAARARDLKTQIVMSGTQERK